MPPDAADRPGPGDRSDVGDRSDSRGRSDSAERITALVRAHGWVLTRAEAAKAGLSRHGVQWAVATGLLQPVRRGVYTTTAAWRQASPERRHRLEILGHQRVNPHLVACETSAAIVLNLPTPSGPPRQPQLTTARTPEQLQRGIRSARGHRGGQIVRRSLLSPAEVWTLKSGIRVTSPVRTVLDCARAWDPPWGLAAAEAAVTAWDIAPADLAAAATAKPRAPGMRRVRWVVEHTRAKVESPLESVARAVVVLAGLPEPTPQVWVRTRAGEFRVDLLDEANKVITEADGKLKYGSAADLWREKRREDALRDSGFEVVRFSFADYYQQDAWLDGYRRAMDRGARRLRAP